ncbi:hypothetical protein GCM10008949_02240 [Deinococcus humi]|nr:hypothetical protein GCM10008949_02240 [Deinococcus humi]
MLSPPLFAGTRGLADELALADLGAPALFLLCKRVQHDRTDSGLAPNRSGDPGVAGSAYNARDAAGHRNIDRGGSLDAWLLN